MTADSKGGPVVPFHGVFAIENELIITQQFLTLFCCTKAIVMNCQVFYVHVCPGVGLYITILLKFSG